MHNKVLLIGIDGMDSALLSKFAAELPNFSKLIDKGTFINFRSVFPPDSATANSSIYTGLNPGKTGIVHFKNPLDPDSFSKSVDDLEEIMFNRLAGTYFWDHASRHHKKSCILFPHEVYPAYEINGTMVCRTTRAHSAQYPLTTFPETPFKELDLAYLNTITAIPTKKDAQLTKIYNSYKKLLDDEFKFAYEMYNKDEWDLFFVYSGVLDGIQHCFWNYYDIEDPTYKPDSRFNSAIKEFYIYYDSKIGELIKTIGDETTIIIFSDHGHGMRPVNLININEILRNEGHLASKVNESVSESAYKTAEKIKKTMTAVVNKYNMWTYAKKIINVLPFIRKLYTSSAAIDYQRTKACVADLSGGIKTYSYAGIAINRDIIKDHEYDEFRDLLIEKLCTIKHPCNNIPIVKWICPREELYNGPYVKKFPDILLELDDNYGVGWFIHCPITGYSATHDFQPGGHKANGTVFLIANLQNRKVSRNTMTLMDITPTVLDIMGINIEANSFDGTSILQ
jgi:predicted AlkP superfamily phosphohydrolase/phosphomutase